MTLFFILLLKIFPLYVNIILGYISTRYLNITREAIANLLETLARGLQANAISRAEAVNLVSKIKRINAEIENFADLEG